MPSWAAFRIAGGSAVGGSRSETLRCWAQPKSRTIGEWACAVPEGSTASLLRANRLDDDLPLTVIEGRSWSGFALYDAFT